MTTEQFYKERIIQYYTWLESLVKNSSSFGYTDLNISLESFVVKLLKLLDIGDYSNCNSSVINFPTIDIFDEDKKIGIQITGECTASKIEDTFSKKGNYKLKFFFLNSIYTPNKRTFSKYNDFNENDIINFKKCLKMAEEKEKLEELYKLYKENIIIPVNIDDLHIKEGYEIYEQEFFMNNMKQICERFVSTSITFKCLEHLGKNNLLVLTGNPGVGKTYNSYFLTANLMEKGYILLHSPNNDLKDIMRKYNENDKFVLFIDDVFGSNDNNFMRAIGEEELVSILNSKKDNLKIIINSRGTIFQDVNNQFDKIQRLRLEPFIIEVSDFSYLEKARILVKHLECNNVPKENIKELFIKDSYSPSIFPGRERIYKILSHKNYNPRAIDDATYMFNGHKGFYSYLVDILDAPHLIYEHTYENNLNKNDQEILRIIYLKSWSMYEHNILVDDIYALAYKLNISENIVKKSLRKLEKYFIYLYQNEGDKTVCKFCNPSILDFCRNVFESSYDLVKYVDLIDTTADLKNLIYNKKIPDSKKVERMYELGYSDYEDIISLDIEEIKKNEKYSNFIIDDIFNKRNQYYINMEPFCKTNFISDDEFIKKIEYSKNIYKYISLNRSEPRYAITKRIIKLIYSFSDDKQNDILTALSVALTEEIMAEVVEYIYSAQEVEDCDEVSLDYEYNSCKEDVWYNFNDYIESNQINITKYDLDYIFGAIADFDYSDYDDDIARSFSENDGVQSFSDDEIETVRFLHEYSTNI